MDTENKVVNQEPQQAPQQPQKEDKKKKKNKFIAWWIGLNKWAKVGICAGTAAVLATGITLGVVLSRPNSVTFDMESDSGSYYSPTSNLKKGITYVYNLKVGNKKPTSFTIHYGTEGERATISSFNLSGTDVTWNADADSKGYRGDQIVSGNISFKVTIAHDAPDAKAIVDCGEG